MSTKHIRDLIKKFMQFLFMLKIMPSFIDAYTVPFKAVSVEYNMIKPAVLQPSKFSNMHFLVHP